MDTKELVKGCIQGSREHQEAFYQKFADKMYAVSCTYSSSQDDAADILQESFIKAFRHMRSYKNKGSLEAWFRRIVVNTAIEHYRKENRKSEHYEQYKYVDHNKVDDILDDLNYQDIIRMVNDLPQQAGMVLKLFVIEGYSHKEIAKQLKISVGTSKSQLNRARYLMIEAIESIHEDE